MKKFRFVLSMLAVVFAVASSFAFQSRSQSIVPAWIDTTTSPHSCVAEPSLVCEGDNQPCEKEIDNVNRQLFEYTQTGSCGAPLQMD